MRVQAAQGHENVPQDKVPAVEGEGEGAFFRQIDNSGRQRSVPPHRREIARMLPLRLTTVALTETRLRVL